MKNLSIIIAANITYSGFTYNTKLLVEYKHTGKEWVYRKKHSKNETITSNEEIAADRIKKGFIVKELPPYYFISRLAIPSITASGKQDWWYINNLGDQYRINKVSKYGKKVHSILSNPVKCNDLSQIKNLEVKC